MVPVQLFAYAFVMHSNDNIILHNNHIKRPFFEDVLDPLKYLKMPY